MKRLIDTFTDRYENKYYMYVYASCGRRKIKVIKVFEQYRLFEVYFLKDN